MLSISIAASQPAVESAVGRGKKEKNDGEGKKKRKIFL